MDDQIKNGSLMLVLCAAVIIYVLVQAVVFIRKAWKRGEELEIGTSKMKKIMINGVLVSIVPSLPIIIGLLVLMQGFGKFFPWLRLSVLGSVTYETMVAEQVATGFGLESFSSPAFTGDIFISAMWAMTIAITGGLICDIFFLKPIDKKMKQARTGKNAEFIPIAISALFPALIAVFAVPHLLDFPNPNSLIAFVVSSIAVLILGLIAKKLNIKALNEFAMAVAMLAGMGTIILINM